MIDLRPHQQTGYDQICQAVREGHKRIVLAAPCSYGKTILAAYMLNEGRKKGKKGFFIADRIQLIQQSMEKFDNYGMAPGVIQGQNERANYKALVQVASIQTLARRTRLPDCSFFMVDECHVLYKYHQTMMETYNNSIFIGLSATPFSKGLGDHFTKLIVPITTAELVDKGYLAPLKYFGGEVPDLEGIKTVKQAHGILDYDKKQLEERVNKPSLVGDIIRTWKEKAAGRQTVCFAQSIKHSKYIVEEFRKAGVPSAHMDAYTKVEDRQEILKQHDSGEFLILSCCTLLDTGWDSPQTSCLIDASPTKSLIRHVQKYGRVMRICEGKDHSIILDHAGNTLRHGFVEDIVPTTLHNGKEYIEKDLVKQDKEKKPVECVRCHSIMVGMRCPDCGFEVVIKKEVVVSPGELRELERAKDNDMKEWYQMLAYHGKEKGYSEGWSAWKFKEKFKSFPPDRYKGEYMEPNIEVKKYITYVNIRAAKGRSAAKKGISQLKAVMQ